MKNNARKFEREGKTKDKRLKDLKITQEKLKKAEKRIAELDEIKTDIKTYEVEIQTENTTVERSTNTELTQEMINDEHEKIKTLVQENSDLKLQNQNIENQFKAIEKDANIKKKNTIQGVTSNPDSARRLSPKYRSKQNIHDEEVDKELDEEPVHELSQNNSNSKEKNSKIIYQSNSTVHNPRGEINRVKIKDRDISMSSHESQNGSFVHHGLGIIFK